MTIKKRNYLFVFISAAFMLAIIYRVTFALEVTQLKIVSSAYAYRYLTLGVVDDIVLVFVLSGLLYLLQMMLKRYSKYERFNTCFLGIISIVLLMLMSIVFTIHRKMFTTLVVGFNYTILMNYIKYSADSSVYSSAMSVLDWVYIVSPVLIFLLLCAVSSKYIRYLNLYMMLPIISGILLYLLIDPLGLYQDREMPVIFSSNPVLALIQDGWRYYHNPYEKNKTLPSQAQLHSVKLVDPLFVSHGVVYSDDVKKTVKPMNVIIIVLETVGFNYIFDTSHGNPTPMPFLQSLSKKGMWFSNNYTSGNNTLFAGFTLLTGMYPSAIPRHFEQQNNLRFPGITHWLGAKYSSSFIAASRDDLYFPQALVLNSFQKHYDYLSIPLKTPMISGLNLFNSELDAYDFFQEKSAELTSPFVSVYWSGAAHFPYYDFGSAYRIMNNKNDVRYSSYINNLYLLDTELKRFYTFLEKKKLLDSTIFVIVGDHGEGFGQHANSWLHSTTLYDEQVKVPLLFYQPRIFKPQIISKVTSSVDVMPTLLDALNIPYDANLMQGESLLKKKSSRKYIFVYGDENELAAINMQKNKMIIDYSKGSCKRFDLNHDPKEINPLVCAHDEQEKAIIAFRNYQPEVLKWYNTQLMQNIQGKV